MAVTMVRTEASRVLRTHSHLNFDQPRYKYEIATSAQSSTYTVKDGTRSLSALLTWAFGAGPVGESYIYQREGHLYEARVSFFNTLDNLGFTPGRALASPSDLEEAMSRPLSDAQFVRCLRCHATEVTSEFSADTSNLIAGISCEGCHGPGAKHVAAIEGQIFTAGTPSWETDESFIFNPRRMDPTNSVEFCGACHSTWWDVKLTGANGHATLLSPAYRLVNSKCWRKGDKRLECTACHDPHAQREQRAEAYDSKCLACHQGNVNSPPTDDHQGKACPVTAKNCTSCHMPKVQVPDLHYDLTDHEIRVVVAGQPPPK